MTSNNNSQSSLEKDYAKYIKSITPTHNLFIQMVRAFLVGGSICIIGQFLLNFASNTLGMDKETAGSFCSLILVFLSVLFTGFGLYAPIVKFGGAGALVPITGFANSVASPAIEYKKEGQVFGVGCKIFTIAGPVLLYGIFSSFVLGVVYYLFILYTGSAG
ncbi:MAG: SpoVA/SpoVAEb family sporulation membrane protein [Lachnospiraceae bacterium]|nr:SpoVA/SpoVAEb family sporulation membrane protein [Lachnospiraceae bacterium]